MGVHRGSSAPEDANISEGKGGGDDGDVDETRCGRVAEVEGGEVDEVEDEEEFGGPEVRTYPQEDEGEVEEVALTHTHIHACISVGSSEMVGEGEEQGGPYVAYDNEVTADICGAVDKCLVGGKQVPDVAGLHDGHDDPVDACDDGIEGEGRPHAAVLAPDGMAIMAMITVIGGIEGVVEDCDCEEEP